MVRPLTVLTAVVLTATVAAAAPVNLGYGDVVPVAYAQQTPVPTSPLMRVTDGVFDLNPGRSMDLTDRRILLTFLPDRDRDWGRGKLPIRINGRQEFAEPGLRYNLKDYSDRLVDKQECFLDVVQFVNPKGGQATVTFRLDCV